MSINASGEREYGSHETVSIELLKPGDELRITTASGAEYVINDIQHSATGMVSAYIARISGPPVLHASNGQKRPGSWVPGRYELAGEGLPSTDGTEPEIAVEGAFTVGWLAFVRMLSPNTATHLSHTSPVVAMFLGKQAVHRS